jgi:hypothetical protein
MKLLLFFVTTTNGAASTTVCPSIVVIRSFSIRSIIAANSTGCLNPIN